MVDEFARVQTALIRVGATITSGKLNQYVDVFAKLQTQVERVLANPGSDAGIYKIEAVAKKNLKSIEIALKRLQKVALQINKFIDQPENIRQRAIVNIGAQALGTTTAEQQSFGNFRTPPTLAQTAPTGQPARPAAPRPAAPRPAGQPAPAGEVDI